MQYFPGLSHRFRPEVPLLIVTGLLLYLLWVTLYYVIIAVEASRDAEARVMKASVLARDAELRALKAQVNPHFLFNSLNSISALTSSDASKAREMCILLGDFLRRTLGLGEKAAIPLEERLSLIRAFLAVERFASARASKWKQKILMSPPCTFPCRLCFCGAGRERRRAWYRQFGRGRLIRLTSTRKTAISPSLSRIASIPTPHRAAKRNRPGKCPPASASAIR